MDVYDLLIGFFILTSFITRTFGGDDGLISRIIVADIFGALAIVTFILVGKKFIASGKVQSVWFLMACFAIGILWSFEPLKSLIEVIILVFLTLIFSTLISFYNSPQKFTRLILLFSWSSLVGSIIGLYDSFIGGHGLPRIFPERAMGEALSGFRNAGQAGAYMLISISVLFAFYNCGLFLQLNRKQKNTIRFSLFFSFLFFLTTGKIAAYIGLMAGLFCYFIYKRNLKVVVSAVAIGVVVFFILNYMQLSSPIIYNRLEQKVKTRIVEPYEGKENNAGTNFLKSNFGGALQSFTDNPFTASGIGGFMGRYGRYEVHSTYLKIIGETGLIGIIGYMIFIISFLRFFMIPKQTSINNPYATFLKELFPLIIGCLISWGYTYHLRKREFWIMYAIVFIAYRLMKKWEL
ncbi:MAG: hypothetical protein RIQ33_17, partial [Bacteroidota bacterium]